MEENGDDTLNKGNVKAAVTTIVTKSRGRPKRNIVVETKQDSSDSVAMVQGDDDDDDDEVKPTKRSIKTNKKDSKVIDTNTNNSLIEKSSKKTASTVEKIVRPRLPRGSGVVDKSEEDDKVQLSKKRLLNENAVQNLSKKSRRQETIQSSSTSKDIVLANDKITSSNEIFEELEEEVEEIYDLPDELLEGNKCEQLLIFLKLVAAYVYTILYDVNVKRLTIAVYFSFMCCC